MIAVPLGATRAEEAARAVVALGKHRYVAGRLHLVHALAFDALSDDADDVLTEACAWARATLTEAAVDPASRDERLWRRASEAEIAAVLTGFWTPGERSARARSRLRDTLAELELPVPDHAPFDESVEDGVHPLLIDAGWELVSLAELDAQRHAGAIAAFGDTLAFESARFEEETAIPRPASLFELPAFGPVELLSGASDDGALAAPLVVWAEGHPAYVDYVVRGVRRAARLPEGDACDDARD